MKSVGRPRCFDEEEALDQAVRVFWEKGFDGASLSDLTCAMGIKPASLYAAFGNKHSLFKKALERYETQYLGFVSEALRQATAYAVAEQLLRQTAIFLTRPDFPPRCMTLQTIFATEEAAQINDELIVLRTKTQRDLQRRFLRARHQGDLPKHANPGHLARFVATLCQGMNIQRMNGATRRELLDLIPISLRAWPTNNRASNHK